MKRILIIEDDPIVGHIYRTRLEREGFEIEVCADGHAGFYRTFDFKPDAVLLDLMLPKMNGIDILKKLRSEPKFQRLPVIVFTNAYVPNMIQEAFSAGASQVFNKATLTPRQILDALFAAAEAAAQQGGNIPSDPPPRLSRTIPRLMRRRPRILPIPTDPSPPSQPGPPDPRSLPTTRVFNPS